MLILAIRSHCGSNDTCASNDWAKSIGIEYRYTIELRDKGHHGFVPAEHIAPTAKEAKQFVVTTARTTYNQIERKLI